MSATPPREKPAAQSKPTRSQPGKGAPALEERVRELEAELKKAARRLRLETKKREQIEAELRLSDVRFQSLAAFAHQHLFVLDEEGNYLFSNRKESRSVSGALLPHIGRHQREFHAPEVAGLYDAHIKTVLKTGLSAEFEHFADEEDGRHHHLDTLYPSSIDDRIIAVGGICRDVTRQKVAQHELINSQERFRRAFELGLIGMAITSVEKVWLVVNDRLCEIFGYPREELTRKTWAEITHPEDLPADVAQFERVLAGAVDGYSMEKRFIRKDGSIMHAEISAKCLRRADGSVEYFVAFVQDITARKRALEAIRDSEQRLQYALDATAEGVWDWNLRTDEVLFSRQWKTSLGYSPDEVPERLEFWESIVHPEDMPRVRQILNEHFEGRTPVYVCENRLRMKSGEYRRNLDRGMVVERDESGKPLRMVGTDSDITELKNAQNDLLQANQRLKAIFDASHQAIFLIDTAGIIFAANEELARRLDSLAADMIGKSIYGFLPKEVSESRKQQVEKVVRTGQTIRFEDKRQDQISSQTLRPIFDAQGNVAQLAVYAEDVTEQRRSEEALRQSEARYRLIVETANEGIWSMDGDYRTTFVNRRLADMLGYAPEEMIGRRVDSFMFPEDLSDHESQMAARARGEGRVYERRFRCRDGREVWTVVSATALLDPQGGFAGSFAMFTDITSRRQAEESLQESEIRYRIVADNTHDWEFWIGPDGKFIYSSPSCLRTTGYRPEDFLRRPGLMKEIIHPEDRAAWEEHRPMAPRSPREGRAEFRIIRADGEARWLEHICQPVFDPSGKFLGWRASNRDITARKQAEERIARSEDLLRKTQRLTGVGGWEWDVQARTMLWTEETYRIHEMEPGELAPGSAEHIACSLARYDEPDRERLVDAFRRCADEGGRYDLILPFTTVKGRRIWVRTVAEAVWRAGKIARVVGNIMDITERKRSEEILQEREELFRNTFDLSPVGVVIVGLDRRFVRCNSAFCRFLGYPEDELIGKTFLEVTHPEDRHIGLAELKQLIDRDLNLAHFQKRYLRKDGQTVWGEITIRLVSDQAERPLFFLPVIQDITMRRLAEEQLELQGKVFDQTSDRVVITDMDATIRYVNQAQCRAVKRRRDELIGKKPDVLGEDPQRGATQRQILEATLSRGEWRGEVINIAADGAETLVDLRTFVVRDVAGKALALAGIGTDITVQKRAEAALRENEFFLRETQKIGRMGGWKANPHTDFLKWTEGVYEIIGAPRDYAPGLSEGLAFFLPECIPRLRYRLQRCLEIGEPFQMECQVKTICGDHLWTEVRGLRSVQEGAGSYVIGTFQDIDDRKKSETELSQSREKLRDLYRQLQNAREDERKRISREIHDELGQNITATKIGLAWLRKRIEPPQAALLQKLTSMEAVVDATLETVRRVSSELRPGILDALGLSAAVEWLVKDFQARSEIECHLYIEPIEIQAPPNMSVDVFRILQEALTNVLRHSRASSVEVTLKQRENLIELHVNDNGIGISEQTALDPKSLGLLGIRERLAVYGGELNLQGFPEAGTHLYAAIPTQWRENAT